MNDRERDRGKSPKPSDEQDSPSPVRPVTPQEQAGSSVQQLEDPPQAEGDRDSVEER